MVVTRSKPTTEMNQEFARPSAHTIHIGGKPKSISFSGCGFLGLYHIGVASCLKQHAPKLVKSFDRIYGCSAGSIMGAMLLTDVCFGDVCHRTMKIVREIRSRYLGALSPSFKLNETLIQDLRAGLPDDAHTLATGKLFISLTRVCDGQNVIVSDYSSREELIQVLICSCFVPIYSGLFPPKYRGVRYVDGGLSNNLPADDDTITVSPWSGNSDICPRNDTSTSLLDLSFVNTSIQMNASNLSRVCSMFLPQDPKDLTEFCSQGFRETVQYLCDHGLFETVHPRRRNLTFSSQLSRLSERKRITRRLSVTAKKLSNLLDVSEAQEPHDRRSNSVSSQSSDSSSGGIDLCIGETNLKEHPLDECFDENDNSFEAENQFALNRHEEFDCSPKGEKAYTVIHAYPVDDHHMLKLEFHLPPIMQNALENAFEHDGLVSRIPLAKLLYSFRNSFVIRIPIDRSYRTACFILEKAQSIPADLHWLSDHLRRLVEKLQAIFCCSGQNLVNKLQTASGKAKRRVQSLADQINLTIHLLIKSMASSSHWLGSWLQPLLNYRIIANTLPSITLNNSNVIFQAS